MKSQKSTLTALAAAFVLAGSTIIVPAFAMQNIKCVKAGAGSKMIAWSGAAGGLLKSMDSEEGAKGLSSSLARLVEQGGELGSTCKTCGAEKAAERVSGLTGTLKRLASAGEIEPGSEAWEMTASVLSDIESLPKEFDL